jgi:DNA (cytosine-5)-methyltransferase 1
MGYRATAGIFSASEVGAPHQRKRVFILGYTEGTGFEETEGVDERRECQSYNGNEIRTVSGTTSDPTIPELGYTEGRCDRQQSSEQQGGDTLGRPSETELGDTSSVRCSQFSEESREACTDTQGEERRLHESKGAGTLPNNDALKKGLPYTDNEGLEGSLSEGKSREETEKPIARCSRGKYPARPNEEQYEWEEPRVVKVEPKLGGKSNGYSSRVDRLRALGNGVVPATAAKAFLVLLSRVL